MIASIRKLYAILTKEERLRTLILLSLFIISALFEVLGVASIIPFVQILSDPTIIDTNTQLNYLFTTFNFQSSESFLFAAAMAVLCILLITNITIATSQWAMYRFGASCDYSVSLRLLNLYVRQPYLFFVNRNSSELIKNIVQETNILTYQIVIPILTIISKVIITGFILGLLIYTDPLLAMIIGIFFSSLYLTVYLFYYKKIGNIGQQRLKANALRYKIVNDIFSGIKDIKILGYEDKFIDDYSKPAKTHSFSSATNQIIRQIPRYFIEIIAFGSILLIVLYLLKSKQSLDNALPLISLYAFSGYRLMPSLQQVFSNLTLLKFATPTLDNIFKEFQENVLITNTPTNDDKLQFNKNIQLKNIGFSYDETSILEDISMKIKKGQTIGIIGATGAGKTTLINIVLGLLTPNKGQISIDSELLTPDTIENWQKNIGYVSQTIYLSDSSIAENIAFGVSKKEISHARIEQVARTAQIHDFIMDTLPDQYETIVGERGVKLSGGQRQRIGIARALYHNPQLLILDEATSALDSETEHELMTDIYSFTNEETVIIIAHRLSTLKKCDVIYFFEKGKLITSGSFDALSKDNKQFAKLIELSNI